MGPGYPPNWDEIRRRVYRRDEYTCQECGGKGGPYGDIELHAHHIEPISEGGSHDMSNLQTLCYHCHEAVHDHEFPASSPPVENEDGETLAEYEARVGARPPDDEYFRLPKLRSTDPYPPHDSPGDERTQFEPSRNLNSTRSSIGTTSNSLNLPHPPVKNPYVVIAAPVLGLFMSVSIHILFIVPAIVIAEIIGFTPPDEFLSYTIGVIWIGYTLLGVIGNARGLSDIIRAVIVWLCIVLVIIVLNVVT